MASPYTPPNRRRHKHLIERTAYFLGRFLSKEIAGNAIVKLRSLIRYDKGVKTKIRLGMDGFSSGNKMASGVFNKRKHAYEFTPIVDIIQLRRDEVHRNVLLLVVRLGPMQYEILAFRTREEREAKTLENTFKYILNVNDVENGAANSRSLWDYKSKMIPGEYLDNLTPFSQELWNPAPSIEQTPSSSEWNLPVGQKRIPNYPGTPQITNKAYDNFEFLRQESERAKDDTVVRYMSSNNGYHRADAKPLNSRAYSAHHKRMFHSQDLRPGFSSRTWFTQNSGVQTDFRTQLSYGISKGNNVVPPKLHFRQVKLYVINGRPVTDAICQVMTEPTLPKMPPITYVIKPLSELHLSTNQKLPKVVQDSYDFYTAQQHNEAQCKVVTTSIATQTSFVETSSPQDEHQTNRPDSIRQQVDELSVEVKQLRELIELSKQRDGVRVESPIGAHIIREVSPVNAQSPLSRRDPKPTQTSQPVSAEAARNRQHYKRQAPQPPMLNSPPSADSAYCESEPESVEVPIPKPLYSSTPRKPLKLKRSNSFRVSRRSGIPVMNAKPALKQQPQHQNQQLNNVNMDQQLIKSNVNKTAKPSEARPLGKNAPFSYLRGAALQVNADRKEPNLHVKLQPMRATKPHRIFDSQKPRDTPRLSKSRDSTPHDDIKRPHITRIPVSGIYNATRSGRPSERVPEMTSAASRQRSESPGVRKLMYTGNGGKQANITARPSRSREKVYLPYANDVST